MKVFIKLRSLPENNVFRISINFPPYFHQSKNRFIFPGHLFAAQHVEQDYSQQSKSGAAKGHEAKRGSLQVFGCQF